MLALSKPNMLIRVFGGPEKSVNGKACVTEAAQDWLVSREKPCLLTIDYLNRSV